SCGPSQGWGHEPRPAARRGSHRSAQHGGVPNSPRPAARRGSHRSAPRGGFPVSAPRIVIGASHAGAELALRLRQLDPGVPVLLLGDEPTLPYQRPPLSKGWIGDASADEQALLMRPAAAYAQAGVELRSGV